MIRENCFYWGVASRQGAIFRVSSGLRTCQSWFYFCLGESMPINNIDTRYIFSSRFDLTLGGSTSLEKQK